MSSFNPENFNDSRDTTSSEGASNIVKASKSWKEAFSVWVNFDKLKNGIFTDFIIGLVLGFLMLLIFILIATCVYIFIVIYCGGMENLKTLLSQIGSIIISFGGWITASILAIKQKK